MNNKNLKVGDKVFIKKGLVPGKYYGATSYVESMAQGWCEVLEIFSKSGTFSVKTDNGNSWEFIYHYTPEMVDWEKTRKIRREKMNINNLKVGDKVYIREDLEDGGRYQDILYLSQMGSGILTVSGVASDGIRFLCDGSGWNYCEEMIDWEKTSKLNNSSCFKEIIQSGESGNEVTKATTYDGREITVKNNNEENDVEKAVMLLMLKQHGFTYGDVKREVEKVKVKWVPKLYEECYTILGSCVVMRTSYSKNREDTERLSIGNYFKTREEAERKAEEIKEVLRGE